MAPEAILVPFGVLELNRGPVAIHQPMFAFGHSKGTSDFVADGLELWWVERNAAHPGVKRLHIELDNGPEIASSRTQFPKRLVEFADRHRVAIELVYLPPYHSKYNPVERCLDGETVRLKDEEDTTKRSLSQIRADIGRLVDVLKSLGAKGLASVRDELERLEAEERRLVATLAQIAKRQAPVERIGRDAQAFLETWQDVGELLAAATTEERLQILQHYIEVIELGNIDRETRTGTYALRLLPEVRPDRGFDFGRGGKSGPDDANPRLETSNGAVPCCGDGSVVVNPGTAWFAQPYKKLPG